MNHSQTGLKLKVFALTAVMVALVFCFSSYLSDGGPDRTNAIQVPLVLLVLGAPGLSYALRRRERKLQLLLLVAQFLAYIVYETGISIQTNIRVDLLLIYCALSFNAWIVLGRALIIQLEVRVDTISHTNTKSVSRYP